MPHQADHSWFGLDHIYSDAASVELVDIVSKRGIIELLEHGGNTGKWCIALTSISREASVSILDHQGQMDVAMLHADA